MSEGTERGSYRESLAYGALSFVAIAVLSLASAIVSARLYGIETIGEFALAYAPTAAVAFLSNVGQQPALVRLIAVLPARGDRVSGVFLAALGFSSALTAVVAAMIAAATLVMLPGPIGQPDLVAPALVSLLGYVIVTNPCWNLDMALASFRAGRSLFWVRLHQAAVYLVLVVGLYPLLPSVWGLLAALLGSWATSLVHRGLASRRWLRFRVSGATFSEGLRTLPQLIRFGIKVTPGVLAEGTANQAGTWILGVVASVASVGAWNRALMVGQRLLEVRHRIAEVLLPTLVERRQASDGPGYDLALIDSLRYATVALMLPAAVLSGAAHSIMDLFGAGFSRAARPYNSWS